MSRWKICEIYADGNDGWGGDKLSDGLYTLGLLSKMASVSKFSLDPMSEYQTQVDAQGIVEYDALQLIVGDSQKGCPTDQRQR